jgi:hypothetical protein
VLPDQPGERLLRDVFRIIRPQQVGQPDHLRVPGAEQPGDARGDVLAGFQNGAPGVQASIKVCHAHKTPVPVKG